MLKRFTRTAARAPEQGDDGVRPSLKRARRVAQRHPVTDVAAVVLVCLSVLCGLTTYLILTGLTPVKPNPSLTVWLLSANAVLVIAMAVMIATQLAKLVSARKRGIAGAALRIRLVTLFGLIAVLPAIIVAVFASVTLNRGLDAWFSERTTSIVDSSITVAQSYLREHGEVTRQAVAQIAADLNQQRPLFDSDRQAFIKRLASHAVLRGLIAAYVIDRDKRILDASVTANDRIQFRAPSDDNFAEADKGTLVVIGPGDGSIIRALVKLSNFDNRYLYIYRLIDPEVLRQLAKAQETKAEFDQLLGTRLGVQVTFALVYTGVSCIFLLSSLWLAFWVADRLVEPVVNLVDAARRITAGELEVQVPESSEADMQTLTRAFNRMTGQLAAQRNALVTANELLDERRRFTEAMLEGVSAGVIGIDSNGIITLVNRSAQNLLGRAAPDLVSRLVDEQLPELAPVYHQAAAKNSGSAEDQVHIRVGAQDRTLVVRTTTEHSGEEDHGYVMTFDDITELVSAQRNSAWADIARRIAHEIKNPLTPIQLSAERLRRKYGSEITSDPKVFEQCTDTIIRQVGDIGRMVDEFSSFARMPSAVLEPGDLAKAVRDAMVLQRVSSSDITFDLDVPEEGLVCAFDRRLITQAVTNLVKNAREAIEARQQAAPEPPGHITVSARIADGEAVISVTDNGIGLPSENRHRLTEPYMTTREKGTGLGLAIVKRIMEDHGGKLVLTEAPAAAAGTGTGATIILAFPAVTAAQEPAAAAGA